MKAHSLFDPLVNITQRLAAVDLISWVRIPAQIAYCFASYLSIIRSGTFNPSTSLIRPVTPTVNFGDVLAGCFVKTLVLPMSKLVIATNKNDILLCFWRTGAYEKHPVHAFATEEGHAEDGSKLYTEVSKETLSAVIDKLMSSNFERLWWFRAYDVYGSTIERGQQKREIAGSKVKDWQTDLKTEGGFIVEEKVLHAAIVDFTSIPNRVPGEEPLHGCFDDFVVYHNGINIRRERLSKKATERVAIRA